MDGPLTILVHAGLNGAFSLYEDDGNTFNYRRGEYSRVNFAWNDSQRRLKIHLENGSRMRGSVKRNMVAQVAGESLTREVVFTGDPIELKL